jgi:hypothetical protein
VSGKWTNCVDSLLYSLDILRRKCAVSEYPHHCLSPLEVYLWLETWRENS